MTMTASHLMRFIKRRSAFVSTSALALGLALGPCQTAFAQVTGPGGGGFQGTGQIVSGEGDIDQGPDFDTISVFGEQTVIDWTPNDTEINGLDIDFLPDGSAAIFQGDTSLANFTVLNRIIAADSSRAIILNGNIQSQFGFGQGGVTGGAVWFYAPGGVVVGSTATVDVGGLFLTASDPLLDANGDFIDANGTTVFQQAQFTNARAAIEAEATVNLTPENSYIGMFAPNVQQSGNVSVNGSAAYVAAEAGSITFNQGLFDINVTIGTDGEAANGQAITHNGTTTGPASSGAGDFHRIYMVAVPKNTAITMAIENSGDLGFDVAGAADVEGNTVILSAGYNVSGDSFAADPVNGIDASISLSGVNINSNLSGQATNTARISTFAGDVIAASNIRLQGDNNAGLGSTVNGGTINIAGDLQLSSDNFANGIGEDGIAGTLNINILNGGNISIAGDAIFSAAGRGGDNFNGTGALGRGQGGNIFVTIADGSSLNIGNDFLVDTSGGAGFGFADTASASGTGGRFNLLMTGGASSIDVGGNFFIDASGFGSEDNDGSGDNTGNGGTISLSLDDAAHTLTIGNNFTVQANGLGGDTFDGSIGGFGQGGNIFANFFDGSILTVGTDIRFEAMGSGGSLQASFGAIGTGGGADGGDIIVQFANGAVANIGQDLTFDASALGGFTGIDTQGVDTGTGGNAQGGNAQLSVIGGSNLAVTGITNLEANGMGGASSAAGSGFGGDALIDVNNGGSAIFTGEIFASAMGTGGGNDTGTGTTGLGQGGSAAIVATSNGIITAANSVSLNVDGTAGFTETNGVNGGSGFGGNTSISQDTQGLINIAGSVLLNANGNGASNTGGDNIAGNGTGGDARIAVNSAGAGTDDISISIGGSATVQAIGRGGSASGEGIRGGDGTGGLANIGAASGRLLIQGASLVDANGLGGAAFNDGSGGTGTGGEALVGTVSTGALIELGAGLTLISTGTGGQGSGPGNVGGTGQGGRSEIFANSGMVDIVGAVSADSSGIGGIGVLSANGGNGLGALSSIDVAGDGLVAIDGEVLMMSDATGGQSEIGGGGDATAGSTRFIVNNAASAIEISGRAIFRANAQTGNAGLDAGDAIGGDADIILNDGGRVTIGDVVDIAVNANAGNSLINGSGGAAQAGNIRFLAAGENAGSITTGNIIATADAFGGSAADGGNGGAATAGNFSIQFGTADILSTINVGDIGLSLMASAGSGGNNSLAGSNGGNGGDASGGSVLIAGQAARGALSTGNINIFTAISAGRGGDGGNSGNGGNGGNVLAGGLYQIGTISGGVTGQTLGSASFGDIMVNSSVNGGDGGNSGLDANGNPDGNGGLGGSAIGNSVLFLSRGSPTSFGNITVFTGTMGGNGGIGNIEGNGGDAAGGDLTLLATNRFDLTDRGDVTAGDIMFSNLTSAGDGAVTGQSMSGTAAIQLTQSDALINSFVANVTGGFIDPVTNPSFIFAEDSILNITDNLTLTTEGYLAVFTQNILNTDTAINVGGDLSLAASTFVSDITNSGTFPENPGLLTVNGNAFFTSPQDVILSTNLSSANDIFINVVGDAFLFDIISAGNIEIQTDIGDIRTGSLDAASDITLSTNIGFINTGNIVSTGAVALNTVDGLIDVGDVEGGSGIIIGAAMGNINSGILLSNGIIDVNAAAGTINTSDVDAGQSINIFASQQVTTRDLFASMGLISVIAQMGDLQIRRIIGNADVELDAGQNINSGLIDIGGGLNVNAGNDAVFAVIEASSGISIESDGALSVERISTSGLADPQDDFGISLSAGNGIIAGSLSTDENIGLLTIGGDIVAGDISSGGDVVLLSAGGLTTGEIDSAQAAGNFIYFGDSAVIINNPGIDLATLFASNPDPLNGNVLIESIRGGGNLIGAATGNIAFAGAVTLSTLLQIDAGALASFGGLTQAPEIAVRSNDIAIDSDGRLGDENTATISLFSTATDRTVIGDTMLVSGSYTLDAAEAARLRAGSINISGENAGGIFIGDLILTGGDAMNSNLVGANGSLSIDSIENVTVLGGFNITDLAPTNAVFITAPLIEIVTDSGNIIMEGSSPGGSLTLSGDNIHIGSAALLEELSADPFFAGRDEALAEPTPGTNAEAVIQAGSLTFNAGQTLLIQNSGTADSARGFLVDTGNLIINPSDPAGNALDLVIHGATMNADGTLVTDDDVRDTIFTSAPGGFTATSSINGCLLSAASCSTAAAPPPPPPAPPTEPDTGPLPDGGEEDVIATGVRDTQETNNAQDTAASEEQAAQEEPLSEEQEEEAAEKATTKSPINRPVSIINTRTLTNNGPIEEPVTSGGNPNLMGAPVSSGSVSGTGADAGIAAGKQDVGASQ